MKKFKAILVTGCGGDIGQSIGKILRRGYKDVKLIGCDIHDKHAGHFIFDKCEVVPHVDSPDYMKAVEKVVNKYKPDVIIPMSEAELRYCYKNRVIEIAGVPLIMPNLEAMKVGNDKLLTQEFLKQNKLPYAWTIKVSDGKPKEFPCVLKDVAGRGSKGLALVQEKDYEKYKDLGEQFIFQEYLLPDNEEYTCGVFRSKTGEVRTIIFRRVLFKGYTNYGEVVTNKEISELLKSIAEKLDLVGSINVQLRLTNKKGPVVFEINARFSSTVLFRHMSGFKDVVWAINDYFGEPLREYNPIEPGTKIYKGWQEYILYKDGRKATIDNIDFKMRFSSKIKFGLKLWSINSNVLNEAKELIECGLFQYIELTPTPNTEITPFLEYNLPYIIHITTERHGLNIADKEKEEFNLKTIDNCIEWADKLNAKYLILHLGFGLIDDAIEFLNRIDDKRILMENMPKVGLNDEPMIGYTPEQLKELMDNKFGLCLDLNHAIKAAVSLRAPYKEFVQEFLKLNPKMFHISDGKLNNEKDEHLNIGEGDYDFEFLMDCVKENESKYVTLETPRNSDSFDNDRNNLEKLIKLNTFPITKNSD